MLWIIGVCAASVGLVLGVFLGIVGIATTRRAGSEK
jgi:hypothetical protein